VYHCDACQEQYQVRYNYVYQYKDHLGNIRLSYGYDQKAEVLKVIEENHYYPYGLKHTRYNTGQNKYEPDEQNPELIKLKQLPASEQSLYKYKYNSKEWQDELGLNMYAKDMRQYDPAIARWVVQDPVVHYSQSPYNGYDGNPVFWADPSGGNTQDAFGRDKFDSDGNYIAPTDRGAAKIDGNSGKSDVNDGDNGNNGNNKDKEGYNKNPFKKTKSGGWVVNWMREGKDGASLEIANATDYVPKGTIVIFAHGNYNHVASPNGGIYTTEELDYALMSNIPEWKKFREQGGKFTLVLKSCFTGSEGKKGTPERVI